MLRFLPRTQPCLVCRYEGLTGCGGPAPPPEPSPPTPPQWYIETVVAGSQLLKICASVDVAILS